MMEDARLPRRLCASRCDNAYRPLFFSRMRIVTRMVSDWFEWRNFGGLTENLNGDPDYDNFTNGQEDIWDRNPRLRIWWRMAGFLPETIAFVFADTSMVKYLS